MGIFGKRDRNGQRDQDPAAAASVTSPQMTSPQMTSPQMTSPMATSPMALALEPRFMFDAAGAVTGAEITAQAAADSLATATAAPAVSNELVVVDTSVAGYTTLIEDLAPGAQVLEIGAGDDGFQALADALAASGQTYDAIHIVSHGGEGQVQLGTNLLTAGSLADYSSALATVGSSLTTNGDLLLYGCEVGTGTGQAFINDLATVTGADVAASDDLTGAAALGGDWDLEVVVGMVEAVAPFSAQAMTDFSDVLALPNGLQDLTLGNGFSSLNGGATFTDASGYFTINGKAGAGGISTMQQDGTGVFLTIAGGLKNSTGNYFKAVADGTKMETFQLSGITFAEYTPGAIFNITVTGYVSGGGTVSSSVNGSAGADAYTLNMAPFSGQNLTHFKASFDSILNGANTNDCDLSLTNFTVINAAAPSIDPTVTSATYDAFTGNLVVTGTNFTATGGAANDVIAQKITLTGEGGATYQLTASTANVEISSATGFTLALGAVDKAALNQIMNTNGTVSTGTTTYDIDGAAGFIAASAAISDTGVNGVTVSNVQTPTITSGAYNYDTNVMTVTGTSFVHKTGATNDVDLSLLTMTGEGGGIYQLTTATDVEITNGTTFSFTLTGADLVGVESLLNKNGTQAADGATNFNIAAADNWMAGATAATNIADLTGNGITVSSYAVPTITSATYDFTTGAVVFTGTNLVALTGGTNDIVANKFTFTGDGGGIYTLTDTANVEVTSATQFTLTLSATDKLAIGGLLNNNGTTSDATSNTTYNINALEDWAAGAPAANVVVDATGNGITVSNVTAPAITSAAYNYSTNVLTVTGTNFVGEVGVTNDVDISLFTFTGEGGGTYQLTSASDVEVTSATSFTVTLAGADLLGVEALLNKNGTQAADGATNFNLAAADNWMRGAAATTNIADGTNAITVSSYAVPTITSATYDFATGVVAFTGTNLVGLAGGTNDIVANKFSFTGDGGGIYTLTDTANVEVTSATAFTLTLSATDNLAIGGLLNNNGTASDATSNTTYNINALEDWAAGAPTANVVADATNGVTVSGVVAPAITSATYDYNSNILTVTGTNFVNEVGATNDVDISLFTFTGEGGATYQLTSATDVEVTSATAFSVTLSGADLVGVESLLNKNSTQAADNTTNFNLAAADNWMTGAAATTNIVDGTNGITVSNYAAPTITSATFDANTGALVLTGTNFVSKSGTTNDIIANLLTITGEGGNYTLTDTANVEVTSATAATLTLSATDMLNIRGLLNKNLTVSSGGTTYNLAVADNWMAGTPAATNIADLTGNGITVSSVQTPTITSATYDSDTGVVSVTGTNFFKKVGAANDVDLSTLTFTGGTANATYVVTTASDVEITSATSFTFTLAGADKTSVDNLLDQIGTTSSAGSTYNLAGADNWLIGADAATNIADAANGVTVSINPKVTSATYDATAGTLVVTGTNIQANGGGLDIDASTFTLTGEGGEVYALTDTADVNRTNATSFTLTLSATDKAALNQIMNKDGTASTGTTTFNIAAADDWNTQVTAGDTSDATNAVTVSNVPVPAITGTTYNAGTGVLTLTGTGFTKLTGGSNDIDATKFTFTGEGGATYTLTTTAGVDITSGTAATLTLSAADQEQVNRIMNKDGTSATSTTLYNIEAAEDWARGADATVTVVDATTGVTVSNVAVPTITGTAYDAAAGTLTATGTGFLSATGATNDIVANKFKFTGEGGATYVLTDTSNAEITSTTGFTITLSATDKAALNQIMNKDGTSATSTTLYNVEAAEDWAAGADVAVVVVDLTTGVTASNVPAPTITSSTYDVATGNLVVTGTGFTSATGVANDIDVSLFTFTGASGASYQLTTATDVEITSGTQFTVTLAGADKTAVDSLMNKDGTANTSGTAYNLAAADNWARGADGTLNIADSTASVAASNVPVPVITGTTYYANYGGVGSLILSGTNFTSLTGANNDIDATKFTFTGEGGATYTLTDTADVEINSATSATLTLSAADQEQVNRIMNKDGLVATSTTPYNIEAAEDWARGADAGAIVIDLITGVTVSGVVAPQIDTTTYNAGTGTLVLTGTNFVHASGAANDIVASLLTFTGEAGGTHTLTDTANVEITSGTTATVVLSATDKAAVNALMNAEGTASLDATAYNLAAAEDWVAGAAAAVNVADPTATVDVTIPPEVTIPTSSGGLNITQIMPSAPPPPTGEPDGAPQDGSDSGTGDDGVPPTVDEPVQVPVQPVGMAAGPKSNSAGEQTGYTYGEGADTGDLDALMIVSDVVNGQGNKVNSFYGAGQIGIAGFSGIGGFGRNGGADGTGGGSGGNSGNSFRNDLGNVLGNSITGGGFGFGDGFGDEFNAGEDNDAPGDGAALQPAGKASFANQLAAASNGLAPDMQRLAAAMAKA